MTINMMLLSEYTLDTFILGDIDESTMNASHRPQKTQNKPPNVGETQIKHCSFFRIVLQRVQYNIQQPIAKTRCHK